MSEDFYIENEYTKELDKSLITKENLMLTGPTGVGKTAIVKSWLNHNKDKINGYYIDAATISNCGSEILQKDDLTLIGQIFSSETIDLLTLLSNLVIVVDNYHLISKSVKEHIMLLCDGYVVDFRQQNDFKKINNIEFVCLIKTTNV